MTQFSVPLLATPSQSLLVALAGQQCRIEISQKSTGVFFSLWIDAPQQNEVAIINGRICLNLVRLVLTGIIGDLFFVDTAGNSDPTYDGLGTRYILIYDDSL